LLDWTNTPTEGVGTSPAQQFFGRRCKTLLPAMHSQLKPQYSTTEDTQALQGLKAKQQHYYNRCAKDLSPIPRGATVRLRLPGETTWTPGVCTGQCGPRSYKVRVGDREFRRDRRQLLHTREQLPLDLPDGEPNATPQPDTRETDGSTDQQMPEIPSASSPKPEDPPTTSVHPPAEPSPQPPRRSGRARKPPEWITNYVPM